MGYRAWTKEEEGIVKDMIKNHKIKEIAEILNRSFDSIYSKVVRMRKNREIPCVKTFQFTQDEIEMIVNMHGKYSLVEIAKTIGHTFHSVRKAVTELREEGRLAQWGVNRPWTEQEEMLITKLYGYQTEAEISKILNRKIGSVRGKINMMRKYGKLQCENKHIPWTIEDEAVIVDMYKKHSYAEIAESIGRNYNSVASRISIMKRNGKL